MIVTDRSILRQKSKKTTVEQVEELNLVARIKEAVGKGFGAAAIQIGVPRRFAWFRIGVKEYTLLNPKIVEFKGKEKIKQEACLSIPGRWSMVPRYYKIKYMNDGVLKTARGVEAHIIQHEIDHMDGILNIDKAR